MISHEHPTGGWIGTPAVWMSSRTNKDTRLTRSIHRMAALGLTWVSQLYTLVQSKRTHGEAELPAVLKLSETTPGRDKSNGDHTTAERWVELRPVPCENWLGSRDPRAVGEFRLVYNLSLDGSIFKLPMSRCNRVSGDQGKS